MVRYVKDILIALIISLMHSMSIAQDCGCSISDVVNNTVNSCNYNIGTTIIVTTKMEFINAVKQANKTGGNTTILIADGTYQIASESWYPHIIANNVVIRSLSGNRDAVILTGSGMANIAPDVETGIYAAGDNIIIADLTIKALGNHGIAVSGDDLYVHNVKIQNTFEQMIKGNNTGNGIHNGTVQCSLFEYTDGVGPQWYIGGLDIHAGINWRVSDNVFKNISSPSEAVAEHAIHFWDSSSNNIIERNIIINCDRGIGFGLGSRPNVGGIIKNNMIVNNGKDKFNDVGISLESSPNTKVYNNSIFIDYPHAIEYRFSTTKNVDIANNLTNHSIKSRDKGVAILKANNTDARESWFINTLTGDLRLVRNIPEIVDRGIAIEEIMIDVDKISRPQLNGFDIGACEYSAQTNYGIEK